MRVILLLCCAVSAVFSESVDKFVVGGSNANIANYNWQVSLRVSNSHSCGASLISGTKAVCAAHCGGGAIGTYSTLTGSSDRTVTTCATCAVRSLTQFNRHAGYTSGGGYPNDIATLYFANIPTNANTGFATMAAANAGDYSGQTGTITGWGRTNIGTSGTLPTILQQGTMTVMTNAACTGVWGNSINAGHICVTSPTVSSCNGDSGGPLTIGRTLIGATSWGNANCNPNQPSIYSRVSYFNGWINSN